MGKVSGLRWTDAADATPEALTAALQAAGTLGSGATVTDVSAEQIGVGQGILALLWRLTMTYEPAGAGPPTMILKLPHTMPESRHISAAFRFYEREVRFYEEIGHATPLPTADCYVSSLDPESGDFVLLIEDFGQRVLHDQVAGCPLDDAEKALHVLAAHHAAWWNDEAVIGADWTVMIKDPPNPQALVPALEQSWPIIESQFADLLPGPTLDAAKRFPQVCVDIMERLSERPVTLVHGDYRLDNIFFAQAGQTPEVAVVDWQICGIARAPYDVAYFLSQSILPEERKANEQRLVRGYHDALVAAGVRDYGFETCWEDYRLATLFCWAYPLNAGAVDLVNDRAVELFRSMLSRSTTAIVDLDALELMPGR